MYGVYDRFQLLSDQIKRERVAQKGHKNFTEDTPQYKMFTPYILHFNKWFIFLQFFQNFEMIDSNAKMIFH